MAICTCRAAPPAINAGLNSANTTLLDLDGNPRVVDGTIDMGAFEFHHQATAVSSFTLINADNDEDIRELKDGDTLNLAILPSVNLNIRANTNPAITGSVTFDLSGQQTRNHIENNAPYALFANNKGDYYALDPFHR
ncbi:MAG: choice-of-anchor Q domain-containing protein [Segetibacter sp.]